MRIPESLRRTAWPIVATVATTATYLAFPRLADLLRLDADAEPLRLIIGAASYFASAWLGGRQVGIALERASQRRARVPRLMKELISVGLFAADGISTIITEHAHSTSGPRAGTGNG